MLWQPSRDGGMEVECAVSTIKIDILQRKSDGKYAICSEDGNDDDDDDDDEVGVFVSKYANRRQTH